MSRFFHVLMQQTTCQNCINRGIILMISYKWEYALIRHACFSASPALLIFKKGVKNMDTVPDGNRIPVHLCKTNKLGMFFAVR